MRAFVCVSLLLLVVHAAPLERQAAQHAAARANSPVDDVPRAALARAPSGLGKVASVKAPKARASDALSAPVVREDKPIKNNNKHNNAPKAQAQNHKPNQPKHKAGGGAEQGAVLIDKSHEAPWYHYSYHGPDGYHFRNGYNYRHGYHYRDGYQYRSGPHPGNGYEYREGFHFKNGNYYTYF